MSVRFDIMNQVSIISIEYGMVCILDRLKTETFMMETFMMEIELM